MKLCAARWAPDLLLQLEQLLLLLLQHLQLLLGRHHGVGEGLQRHLGGGAQRRGRLAHRARGQTAHRGGHAERTHWSGQRGEGSEGRGMINNQHGNRK